MRTSFDFGSDFERSFCAFFHARNRTHTAGSGPTCDGRRDLGTQFSHLTAAHRYSTIIILVHQYFRFHTSQRHPISRVSQYAPHVSTRPRSRSANTIFSDVLEHAIQKNTRKYIYTHDELSSLCAPHPTANRRAHRFWSPTARLYMCLLYYIPTSVHNFLHR